MEPQSPQLSPTREQKNNYSVPLSIIVAGALVAGAIFLRSEDSTAVKSAGVSVRKFTILPVTSADHIIGNPSAPIKIVEYSDTECPFCKRHHEVLHSIIDTHGKDGSVAWVYRHLPIEQLHAKAFTEAIATECAARLGGEDAFWKYLDRIYSITPSNDGLDPNELNIGAVELGLPLDEFKSCVSEKETEVSVKRDFEDGLQATGGRPGTPFNVIEVSRAISEKTKKKITADMVKIFQEKYNSALDESVMYFSSDGKYLAFSGALPQEMIELMINNLK